MSEPWVCPKCGEVMASWMPSCVSRHSHYDDVEWKSPFAEAVEARRARRDSETRVSPEKTPK